MVCEHVYMNITPPPSQLSGLLRPVKDFKSVFLKDLFYVLYRLWISVQGKKTKSIAICVTFRPDDYPVPTKTV